MMILYTDDNMQVLHVELIHSYKTIYTVALTIKQSVQYQPYTLVYSTVH